ncbi:hypothetical protein [Actinomycetospora sp. CA-084318]|uniref:hypothetical protein n=1 Tax=Actinomycetospora sp. CA-084318 TaxID=3239892 RepID=UPI003D98DDCE
MAADDIDRRPAGPNSREHPVTEFFITATEPSVFTRDASLAFFPTTIDGTWAYANRAPQVAEDGDLYRLTLVRRRKSERNEAGLVELVTKGGTFALQLDTAAVIGSLEEEARWTEAIKRESPFVPAETERLTFRPATLRDTTMSIYGVDALVADPTAFLDVEIGSSTSLPVTLELTADGADTLWRVLEQGGRFPITVALSSTMTLSVPGAHYRITANSRKAWDFFSVDAKARASYFGLVDAEVDVSVARQSLVESGAVTIEWIAKPAGFDDTRIRALEQTIIDTWAKRALQQMTHSVVTDTGAPEPGGFFGGVSVRIKDVHEVEDLDLSAEYRETDLQTAPFTQTTALTLLRDLDVDDYGVDVTGDNVLPVTINLGPDPDHVRRYFCQFGYRRDDGTYTADAREATGPDGLVLAGLLQWSPADPPPAETEIQFLVDFEDLDDEDIRHVVRRDNGEAGVSFTYTPGTYVKDIELSTNLPSAPEGSLATIEWYTDLPPNPEGVEPAIPKNYAGGVTYDGAGAGAPMDKVAITFPYNPETVDGATFSWRALLITPDGRTYEREERRPLAQVSRVAVARALLEEVREDGPNPDPEGVRLRRLLGARHRPTPAPVPRPADATPTTVAVS